jgi:hypothetical protein
MQSDWLRVMLEEIASKRDETERGREEAARRLAEQHATAAPQPRRKAARKR